VDTHDIEFEWDDSNLEHVARHGVTPKEAQEVVLNDPLDLGMQDADGEERWIGLGSTRLGRILIVVTTWRDTRIRVVTAFEPVKRWVRLYFREKGNRRDA
jgi:uncharacterized protein